MNRITTKSLLVAALLGTAMPALAEVNTEFFNLQVLSAKVDVATGNLTVSGTIDCALDEETDYLQVSLTANQHWGNSIPATKGYHNAYGSAAGVAVVDCNGASTGIWSTTFASTDIDKFKPGTAATFNATAEEFDYLAEEEGETADNNVVLKVRNINAP